MSLASRALSLPKTRKGVERSIVPKSQRRDLAEVMDLDTLRKTQLRTVESSELRNILGQQLSSNSGAINGALSSAFEAVQSEPVAFAGAKTRSELDTSAINALIGAAGAGAGVGADASNADVPDSPIGDLVELPKGLTSVRPTAQLAAREIITLFKNPYGIGGVGPRSNKSDHPSGKALDVMVSSGGPANGKQESRGNSIAAYLRKNWSRLGVKYIIWNGRLWNGPNSSRTFRGDGKDGYGGPHRNHVHISFLR